jgi:hypothetical protein
VVHLSIFMEANWALQIREGVSAAPQTAAQADQERGDSNKVSTRKELSLRN